MKFKKELIDQLRAGDVICEYKQSEIETVMKLVMFVWPAYERLYDCAWDINHTLYAFPDIESFGLDMEYCKNPSAPRIPLSDFLEVGEIVGYKVKPEFTEYFIKAAELKYTTVEMANEDTCSFSVYGKYTELFKKMGVLDLWFSPTYAAPKEESKEVTFYEKCAIHSKVITLICNDAIPTEDLQTLITKHSK